MKIFIGYDSRWPECADVLRYSLKKHSSISLDITYLVLNDLIQKHKFQKEHDPLSSTEFTYTRFLVPYLCNYKDYALFMDSDMVCFSDIAEIQNFLLSDFALRVVKHDYYPTNPIKMDGQIQTSYPRKNWSSFMYMNCAKLKIWTKKVVEMASGAYLHRFKDIPDKEIGDFPLAWNCLDWMDNFTKMIHYTNGGPWLKSYEKHPYGHIWYNYRDQMLAYK